jgi:hypothetical protein
LHREELHLAELGIATLTSCFINANRDPKSTAAKPSDFFYFNSTDEQIQIANVCANAFFALADAGFLPSWVVAISPIDKLKSVQDDTRVIAPRAWVGDGVVLMLPRVDGETVRFSLGFQDLPENFPGGIVVVRDVDTGEERAIALSSGGMKWILDGEVDIHQIFI